MSQWRFSENRQKSPIPTQEKFFEKFFPWIFENFGKIFSSVDSPKIPKIWKNFGRKFPKIFAQKFRKIFENFAYVDSQKFSKILGVILEKFEISKFWKFLTFFQKTWRESGSSFLRKYKWRHTCRYCSWLSNKRPMGTLSGQESPFCAFLWKAWNRPKSIF